MKKIAILCAMLLVFLAIPSSFMARENAVFVVENAQATAGSTVTVDIITQNNPGIVSLKLLVSYDKDVLELVSAVEKDFSGVSFGNTSTVPFAVNWVDSINPNNTTDGVIVTLTFKVKETAPIGKTDISISYDPDDVYNFDWDNVEFAISNGSVTIACPHSDTTNMPEVPADCDEIGYTAGVWCNDCETYISGHEVIPATGAHVDADGKWESDADNHYHTCGCGAKFDTPKHTGGPANCVDKATCETCGAEYGPVDSTKHGETEVRNATEATCSKDGYPGDTYCKDCGEKIATGSVIPATGAHVDADGKWESDADNHFHTCGCGAKFDTAKHTGGTANCVDKATCETCGAEYGSVDSTKHGETEVRDASEATCSKDGYTGDTYCKDCGEKIATGSVIPATGAHVDADGKWESDADNHFHTCGCGAKFDTAKHTGGTANCVDKAVCSVCGVEYGEIDEANHNEEVRGKIEATEESEGYTGDTYCKDCGEKLAEGEVIAKLPHTHAMQKTEKKDATHEADGNIEYYTCSKCGKLYKDEAGTEEITIEDTVIAKGEHSYEDAKDENKHWQECECGSKIDEANHTYGEWTETKAPTTSETGSKERACTECGHKQVEELPKLEVPPTGDTVVIVGVLSALAVIAAAVIVSKKKRVRG